uniref:Uncharacterized protein n=1 Tax=Opuntia streptacantha TaxID=393608 RepID=A0A7C9DQ05_OPUST
MVGKLSNGCQGGSLLSTTLRTSTVKDASRLSCKLLCSPQASSSIHKCFKLSSHHAKSSWETEKESICLSKLSRCNDGDIALWWCPHLCKHLIRQRLRNLPEFCFNSFHRCGSSNYLLCQLLNMAIH